MSFLHTLVDKGFTPRRLSWFFAIATVLYMLFPVLMPMKVSSWTKDYIAEIDKLSPGDIVVFGNNWGGVVAARAGLTYNTAVLEYLMSKQLRIVMVAFSQGSDTSFLMFMRDWAKAESKGYVYGTHWVITPYIAGEETAMAAVADNMWYSKTDMFGTPFEQIPLMADIHVLTDAKLTIVDGGGFSWQEMYVRQWAIRHKVRQINDYGFQQIAIFYGIYVFGVLDRTRGQAEFEYATNKPYEEVLKFQFRNIGGAVTFATVILANISLYTKKKEDRVITGVRA